MGEYVKISEAGEIWRETLQALQMSMPAATFQTWLQGSRALGFDHDALIVELPTAAAAEWVSGRLGAQVERTMDRVNDRREMPRLSLRTVVATVDDPPPMDDGTTTAPVPPVSVELVEFDPLKRGYVQASSYAVRFWLPYLGRGPFCTWLVLKSFAYQVETHGGEWPALATLGDILGANRQQITGRRRDSAWKAGWLEVLETEHIVSYSRGSRGRYVFRVLASLPLLSVRQVDQLPESSREAHARWLEQADLDLQAWQSAVLPTLVGDVLTIGKCLM